MRGELNATAALSNVHNFVSDARLSTSRDSFAVANRFDSRSAAQVGRCAFAPNAGQTLVHG
jgi:hypothetical protein